ncbi:hypothetical protein OC846_000012 [Tilletia horrida]|uniref:Cutinase n=1 Tax=Tilletia horrida TaxID=155126 RepID=A0AAN6GYI1_9BASI|nr:hypothetical protein OC845_001325 [Tilletia horrida]KAK0558020.1 hypothetical protein OC846_000012 [Tilletia horrida]KAK0569156.1 hypothetical protein OC861_001192 [Tilletia horrida]
MVGLHLVISALALLGATGSNASPLRRRDCSDYQIVAARGTSNPQNSTFGYTGMVDTVFKTLPGGSFYDVVYPANYFFYPGIPEGVADLTKHLQQSVQNCPKQKYALIGYSQGAEVINRVIVNVNSTLNATVYDRIKSVIYVGNPSHLPNSTANVDQDGGKATDAWKGILSVTGILGPRIPRLDAYISSAKLLDICYTYDLICAFNEPHNSFSNHTLYNNSMGVQTQGAKHMLARLK